MSSMTAPLFDKLAYTEALKAAKIGEPVAIAHANALDVAFRQGVATNAYVNERVSASEQIFSRQISELENGLTRLIAEKHVEMIKWLVGSQVGHCVAILTITKLFK